MTKGTFRSPTACDCSICKKPNWLTTEQHLQEVGKFLGYPKCCINEFIENVRTNTAFGWKRDLAGQYKGAWSGGFIPCTKHAARIIDEGKLVHRIIRNRISSRPFPHSSPFEFSCYLKKIKSKYVKRTKKITSA